MQPFHEQQAPLWAPVPNLVQSAISTQPGNANGTHSLLPEAFMQQLQGRRLYNISFFGAHDWLCGVSLPVCCMCMQHRPCNDHLGVTERHSRCTNVSLLRLIAHAILVGVC